MLNPFLLSGKMPSVIVAFFLANFDRGFLFPLFSIITPGAISFTLPMHNRAEEAEGKIRQTNQAKVEVSLDCF